MPGVGNVCSKRRKQPLARRQTRRVQSPGPRPWLEYPRVFPRKSHVGSFATYVLSDRLRATTFRPQRVETPDRSVSSTMGTKSRKATRNSPLRCFERLGVTLSLHNPLLTGGDDLRNDQSWGKHRASPFEIPASHLRTVSVHDSPKILVETWTSEGYQISAVPIGAQGKQV